MATKLHNDACKILGENIYETLRNWRTKRGLTPNKAWADLMHEQRYVFIVAASDALKAAEKVGIVLRKARKTS